jgi:hypothetical protein
MPNAPIPNEPSIHDLSEATRRLRTVTQGIDSFVSGQLQRLSDALQVYSQVKDEADSVRRLFAEFEIERRQWQDRRDVEVNRIHQASQNLVDAWDELDTQQREFLIEQQRCDAARPTAALGSSPRRGSEGFTPKRPEKLESTLLEIQLLKREIIDHTHRRR